MSTHIFLVFCTSFKNTELISLVYTPAFFQNYDIDALKPWPVSNLVLLNLNIFQKFFFGSAQPTEVSGQASSYFSRVLGCIQKLDWEAQMMTDPSP